MQMTWLAVDQDQGTFCRKLKHSTTLRKQAIFHFCSWLVMHDSLCTRCTQDTQYFWNNYNGFVKLGCLRNPGQFVSHLAGYRLAMKSARSKFYFNFQSFSSLRIGALARIQRSDRDLSRLNRRRPSANEWEIQKPNLCPNGFCFPSVSCANFNSGLKHYTLLSRCEVTDNTIIGWRSNC